MVNTPPQTDTYTTALDIFDRTHPLRVDVDENLKVALPTGAATEATLILLEANSARQYGTFNYYAGASGTVVASSGQRILSFSCHSTTGGSMTINGGASIPIPAGVGFAINLLGNLVAPTVVFTGTDSYFVQVVS